MGEPGWVPGRSVGQRSLRELNLAAVLSAVFDATTPPSRAAIAESTGLAKATVSTLVDQLVGAGLVLELAPVSPGRAGRPAVPLVPRPRSVVGMGMEVNVDYLGLRVLDLTGTVVAERTLARDLVGADPGAVLRELGQHAREVRAEVEAGGMRLAAARLALPGLVRPSRGRLEVAPNLGWHELEPAALLACGDLEIQVRNEAKLAGLAQTTMRAAMSAGGRTASLPSSFLYVSGDVGVGAAVVQERELYLGQHGWSGEIGHVVVVPGGHPCRCGRMGCLEQYAGKAAVLRAAGLSPSDGVALLAGNLRAGQVRAVVALATAVRTLALALADALNLLDVSTVVLGGFYAELFELIGTDVRDLLVDRVLGAPWEPVTVLQAPVGRYAAMIGGAREVLRGVLAHPAAWVPGG